MLGDIVINCMEKVETGGNIRIFAYFTSEDRFFALHGDSGHPLTTVTEIAHLGKISNRGDAQARRMRLEAEIKQRERERFTYVGYRKLLWDGSLGDHYMGDANSLPKIPLDKLPDVIRSKVSEIIANGKPRTIFTATVKGKSAGMVRMALHEAAIAIKGHGMPAELDDGFNLRIGPDYTGSIKPLYADDPENTEFIQTISDQEIKENQFLPGFYWAIVQKVLTKENCTLVDQQGELITNVVGWIFKEFGFDAATEKLAIELGLQPDLSKINIECARF